MFNETNFLIVDNTLYLSTHAQDYMIKGFFTCFLLGLFFMYVCMLFQDVFKEYIKK